MINSETKSILLLASSLALSACNSSDSDSQTNISQDTETPSIESTTFTAIDGYLGDAEVYSDTNLNNVAEPNEYQGLTNSDGTISLPSTALKYPVIVRVIAGQTTDTDVIGPLTENRELIAGIGETIISPFSTLAHLQNMSLSELADQLGIAQEKTDKDFIENNDVEIHALARSLMKLLYENIAQSEQNLSKIKASADAIRKYVEDNYSDLAWEEVTLVIDENGNVSVKGNSDDQMPEEDDLIIGDSDSSNEDGPKNPPEDSVLPFFDGIYASEDGGVFVIIDSENPNANILLGGFCQRICFAGSIDELEGFAFLQGKNANYDNEKLEYVSNELTMDFIENPWGTRFGSENYFLTSSSVIKLTGGGKKISGSVLLAESTIFDTNVKKWLPLSRDHEIHYLEPSLPLDEIIGTHLDGRRGSTFQINSDGSYILNGVSNCTISGNLFLQDEHYRTTDAQAVSCENPKLNGNYSGRFMTKINSEGDKLIFAIFNNEDSAIGGEADLELGIPI